jgi:hypothetical protein
MAAKSAKGKGGVRSGRGRKPIPLAERRRNRVMLNLTDAELEWLERSADGKPISEVAREILFRHRRYRSRR